MSKPRGNRYHHKRNKPALGDNAKEVLQTMDENNPTLKMFKEFSLELDEKHDRYERLVKQSRDITIEAKRIIFLLHNSNTDIESKRATILEEAEKRLQVLFKINFRAIAFELKNQDSYLYHRAYTAGLQEFIEALCFYWFLKNNDIIKWAEINENFMYFEGGPSKSNEDTEAVEKFSLLFPQYDFMLGIGDFTGELMRRCINVLGAGNVSECFKLTNFVRTINTGILGLYSPGCKELSRKAYVLRQSLAKMELVCYNIQIRGSEVPKEMLMSVIESRDMNTDEDEGYY